MGVVLDWTANVLIAPLDMTYGQMCRGVVPFILLQIATLLAVAFFPSLSTWLPSQIVGY